MEKNTRRKYIKTPAVSKYMQGQYDQSYNRPGK
jgi:hypothetical protein